jgi:hypothetical protein
MLLRLPPANVISLFITVPTPLACPFIDSSSFSAKLQGRVALITSKPWIVSDKKLVPCTRGSLNRLNLQFSELFSGVRFNLLSDSLVLIFFIVGG